MRVTPSHVCTLKEIIDEAQAHMRPGKSMTILAHGYTKPGHDELMMGSIPDRPDPTRVLRMSTACVVVKPETRDPRRQAGTPAHHSRKLLLPLSASATSPPASSSSDPN